MGLGLGWIAQKLFPGIEPWGLAGGLFLGAGSGFYQLFRNERVRAERVRREKEKKKAAGEKP